MIDGKFLNLVNGAISGSVGGAVIGSFFGWVGVIVGTLIGGIFVGHVLFSVPVQQHSMKNNKVQTVKSNAQQEAVKGTSKNPF